MADSGHSFRHTVIDSLTPSRFVFRVNESYLQFKECKLARVAAMLVDKSAC